MREKYLRRNEDRLAVVKCSSSIKITINPDQVVEAIEHTDMELDFPPQQPYDKKANYAKYQHQLA